MAEVYVDSCETDVPPIDSTRSIASAVALPDAEDLVDSPPSNGLKRRQSEVSGNDDSSSKRQRTSPGKTSPQSRLNGVEEREQEKEDISSVARARSITPVESKHRRDVNPKSPAQDSRRKSAAVKAPDEKQRSKRLFGALLGNLNRPSDRQSKRRAEIEQRKKAELQKQDDVRLEDRLRRLERLAIQRKNEQLQVDERDMHIRHKNLLSAANYLQTRTEPKLFYRPWDLLPDEEDLIERQLKEAQAQVDQELVEWEDERRSRQGMIKDPPDDKPSKNDHPTQEEAPKDAEPLESDVNMDKEVTIKSTNAQRETDVDATATSNTAKREKSAEVPNSVPTSPQLANSVLGEKEESGKITEPDSIQSEKQQMVEDYEEIKEDEHKPIAPEQPETNANVDAKIATNGAADGDVKDEIDDDGDQIVEGDEDDVIY